MRRTVGRRINKSNKDRLYTIFAFFIVAPIISIVLAFFLVQNVILPRLSEEQKAIGTIEEGLGEEIGKDVDLDIDTSIKDNENMLESETTKEKDEIPDNEDEVVKETIFYGVQIGNFSSITNAEALVKELKEKNINDCYVVNIGESYKVLAGEFHTKDEAYKYLENINKIYEDAFVNTVSDKNKILKPY